MKRILYKLFVVFFLFYFLNYADALNNNEVDDLFRIDVMPKAAKLNDPLEKLNRKVLKFNKTITKKIFTQKKYKKTNAFFNRKRREKTKYASNIIKTGVNNAINNLNGPSNTINFLLQKKPEASFKAFWRFIINSTFGLCGILDIAKLFELPEKRASFEQTMIFYGGKPGAYLILPVIGASSVRGLFADAIEIMINPLSFLIKSKLVVFSIYDYSKIYKSLDYYHLIFDDNIDGYAKLRSVYSQSEFITF